MAGLESWLRQQLDDHLVEPNSGLGTAITYMRKHWVELTLFLRVPGAPLDNNICERALKKAILHRKNALFYKTLTGARSATGRLDELLGPEGPPAARNDAAPGPGVEPGTGQPPHRGVILVVDDNADNRDMLARRRRRRQYDVLTAAGGRAALPARAGTPVDLVLLDVMMPDLDGYAVLERLKADPALRDIPVLMISALDELDSVVRCIQLGAEDYLGKPFEPVLLQARIGACLEKKRLHDREARRRRDLAALNQTLESRVAEQVAQLERLGRLKRSFSPQLAELIVAGGADDPLRTHRREVTVVFIDLRGFTSFAETAEPEEIMGMLREYHAEMGRLILEHEGTLERFTGDGMMIFFMAC